MSILFGQVKGATGSTGDAGGAGPTGITGDTGPQRTFPASSIVQDGLASKYDIRKIRYCSFHPCTTEDSSTSTVKYIDGATDVSDANITKPNSYYSFLCAVRFVYAQTTPLRINISYIVQGANGDTWRTNAGVYINGAVTSATNPLLWRAGSILLFNIGYNKVDFIQYLGNYIDNTKLVHATPFYRYTSIPNEEDLPVRPCFYHVTSVNNWYYCDGLSS